MPLLWEMISARSRGVLADWQAKHYPDNPLSDPRRDIKDVTVKLEDTEEIDQIMRKAPSKSRRES
ncbi:hypothetical protein LCGC14_1389760 [marine sediment metagenome]|uniref:Uncharacterized protein n=1 Tax=marine sediment metagenome TaxID=412755 RepID=A0A0F9N1V9_9ZZZZ